VTQRDKALAGQRNRHLMLLLILMCICGCCCCLQLRHHGISFCSTSMLLLLLPANQVHTRCTNSGDLQQLFNSTSALSDTAALPTVSALMPLPLPLLLLLLPGLHCRLVVASLLLQQ
jgi:hypothetical protein